MDNQNQTEAENKSLRKQIEALTVKHQTLQQQHATTKNINNEYETQIEEETERTKNIK